MSWAIQLNLVFLTGAFLYVRSHDATIIPKHVTILTTSIHALLVRSRTA